MGWVSRVLSCLVLIGSTAAALASDYATAGALQKDDKWEIGVLFDSTVDHDTILSLDSYKLSAGTIESMRLVPPDGAIVLTATGITLTNENILTITNISAASGGTLPQLNLFFYAKEMSWTEIGASQLGFTADAVSVGDTNFDLISGGFQLFDIYDEATFVYERLSGDFDKHVRVDYQDPSSPWARAGLMVREALDTGKPYPSDPSDPAMAFSRYLELHVTPLQTSYGDPASNTHEVNVRYYPGGIGSPNLPTEQPALTNNAAPGYTNAWLRIKRTGQVFEVYRGTNDVQWFQLGSFTFPTNDINGAFPSTVFFGPSYSPENGNIPVNSGTRSAFLARFRDYGGTGNNTPKEAPSINITRLTTGEVEISWTGQAILQTNTAALPVGWSDLAVGSPYRFTPQGKATFFRLRS
jgi:hypothetical protein